MTTLNDPAGMALSTFPRAAPQTDAACNGRDMTWTAADYYTDSGVFELEAERIFVRSWIFVAHESELAKVGDFVTAVVASSPVVIMRGGDGRLRAFHNVCTHRAALLVDEPSGHAEQFRCAYHWWEFSMEGDLIRVPVANAYEYPGCTFDQKKSGLLPVECEVFAGLVFCRLEGGGPSLSDELGEAGEILRKPMEGIQFEVAKKVRYTLAANWKCYTDNARDGYHVPFVHPSLRKLSSTPLPYNLLTRAHSVQYIATNGDKLAGDALSDLLACPLHPGQDMQSFVLQLFPNLLFGFRTSWVAIESMAVLSGPAEVEMEARVLAPVGDTEEQRAARLRSWSQWWDEPNRSEDLPVLERQQRGLSGRGVRRLRMDRGADGMDGVRGDDNRLRHFWHRWHEMMELPRSEG